MKAFNIRTIVSALFVGMLLLTSCEDESTNYNQSNLPTSDNKETITSTYHGEDNAESPKNNVELDSIKNNIENLKKQVDESSNRADKCETEIKNLKEQESSNKFYLLISLILGFIPFVIAIVALIQTSKFNKRLDKHGNDIYNLKQSSDNRISATPRQIDSDEYSQMKSRLKSLEDEVKALKKFKNNIDKNQVSPNIPKSGRVPMTVVETQKGYFGQPAQADSGYFKTFLTTRDSEARFSAEKKQNIATFKPLLNSHAELETLLHTDAAKLAVEFSGCSLQEATQATVLKPGLAEFKNNRWYITQKALIALTS